MYKVLAEYKNNHEFAPPKPYKRPRKILDNIQEETKSLIRRTIHQFFFENELPMLDKILTKVNNNDELPNFKRTTLSTLIKELNFR